MLIKKYNTPNNKTMDTSKSNEMFKFYQQIFTYPITMLAVYFRAWHNTTKPNITNLRFYFKLSTLSLNIESTQPKYNLLSLNPGPIFCKFFEKKHLKNKRQTQTLLMRFLRKVLLFLNLQNFHLIVRGIPFNLKLLLKTLSTPVSHTIRNPFRQDHVFADSAGVFQLRIWLIRFVKTTFFGKRKLKKKGRVKRKVARKILTANRLTD